MGQIPRSTERISSIVLKYSTIINLREVHVLVFNVSASRRVLERIGLISVFKVERLGFVLVLRVERLGLGG